MSHSPKTTLRLIVLLAFSYPTIADESKTKEDIYLAPEAFISEAFEKGAPKPKALWITSSIKPGVQNILGHPYPAARVRYWREGNRSAWILEEIGKVKPITAGFIVEEGAITRLKVLIYRESHGWEVKYPFFTDQFKDAELTKKHRLSKKIDGISGATLSVNALEKLSRLALYFHEAINLKEDSQ